MKTLPCGDYPIGIRGPPERPPVMIALLFLEEYTDEMRSIFPPEERNTITLYRIISGTHRITVCRKHNLAFYPFCLILSNENEAGEIMDWPTLYQIADDTNLEHEEAHNSFPLSRAISLCQYMK